MKARTTIAVAALLLALAANANATDFAQGSYTNTVMAGTTRSGEAVTIVAGVHQNFPFKGANWDDFMIRVGDTNYRYTTTTGNSSLKVESRGSVASVTFNGQLVDSNNVQIGASIVLRGAVKKELNPTKLDIARALDSAIPAPILKICRIERGFGFIRLGSTLHKLESSSIAGHIESSENASLNPIDTKNTFLVYDYVAGVSSSPLAATVPNPVWTNGRLFVGQTSIPVSPPVALTGIAPIITPAETHITSKVQLGPLVLERRLVTFSTVANQTNPAYRGLQEVWTWNGGDVSIVDAAKGWGDTVKSLATDLLNEIDPDGAEKRRGAIDILEGGPAVSRSMPAGGQLAREPAKQVFPEPDFAAHAKALDPAGLPLPLVIFPSKDFDAHNELVAVFVDDSEAGKIHMHLVFRDEDSPGGPLDQGYDGFRWLRYHRVMDVETITAILDAQGNPTDMQFHGTYSGKQTWETNPPEHLSRTIPWSEFAFGSDPLRPALVVNTWNHLLSNKNTNNNMLFQQSDSYPIYAGSRADLERIFDETFYGAATDTKQIKRGLDTIADPFRRFADKLKALAHGK